MRILYTDGSAGANYQKDAGGWAFLEVVQNKITQEKYDCEFSSDISCNKMELRAALEAVKSLNPGDVAQIYSDSQYVVKVIYEWIDVWIKNNWITAKNVPVL